MNRLTPDELIVRVGNFNDWENKEKFMAFRAEMFEAYEMLTEDEQEYVDSSMVMEHIAMVKSCYDEMEKVKNDGKG